MKARTIVCAVAAAAMTLVFAPTPSHAANPTTPTGPQTVTPHAGVAHPATPVGKTETFTVSTTGAVAKTSSIASADAPAVPRELAAGTKFAPVEVVTITTTGPTPGAAGLRAGQTCSTANMYYGSSMLWAKASQVWCWTGASVSYFPPASCWGYSAWYFPSYAYLGCSTFQQYGAGWNIGRMQWNADLCPGWLPGVGACGSHSYVHRNYEFRWNGSWISY